MNSATLTVLQALDHLADPAQARAPSVGFVAYEVQRVDCK